MAQPFYRSHGKRWLDVAGALLGFVILWPMFLFVAIAVRLSGKGPIFFSQARVGQYGNLFRILKFRTMRVDDNAGGSLITAAGDPRITRVGRFLRKTKLDEFPQLVNVLTGEMSLVGPRPEVPEYVAGYSESQRRVLLARPGISSIVAMNNVQEEELLAVQEDADAYYRTVLLPAKLRVDIAYCDNVHFGEDLKIILGTFLRIFGRPRGTISSLAHNPEIET